MSTATTLQTQTTTKPTITPVSGGLLQRACACGNHSGAGGECEKCKKKRAGTLQRAAVNASPVGEVPPIVHEVLRSPGQPLDAGTRAFMEPRFGHDFSGVRMHTDAKAAESARAVNALAYTVGRNVVFGTGQYAPFGTMGRKLIIHELTHVLQQNTSHTNPESLSIDGENTPHEKEAEQITNSLQTKLYNHEFDTKHQTVTQPSNPKLLIQHHAEPSIQCLGDLTRIPSNLSCAVARDNPSYVTENVMFPNGVSSLSNLNKTQIENFVRNWWAAGGNQNIRIDGYASQRGRDELNWRLACQRARSVATELGSPTLGNLRGIPAGFVTVFAQGETSEFGLEAANRLVTLSLSQRAPAAPHPMSPSQIIFIPCTSLPHSIGTRGVCGAGTDFTFHDFPPLGLSDELKVRLLRPESDTMLLTIFRAELGVLARSEGFAAISHFASGTGTKRTHGPASGLGVLTVGSTTFTSALGAVRGVLHRQIVAQAASGRVNCSSLSIAASALPRISFGYLGSTVLKGVIGGTQGLEVQLLDLILNPTTHTYRMSLRFIICDDFGVDAADLYSPGLISFWILQHERAGFRPFINEIIVESTFSDRF